MNTKEYHDKVAWLEKAAPNNVLLMVLKKGYTQINCIYLAQALKGLSHEPDAPQEVQAQAEQDHSTPEPIRLLFVRKRQLFTDRAKLSNSFHGCANDQERKAVSVSIEHLQNEIESLNKQLRDWKERGVVPKGEAEPSEADYLRQIAALNGKISYAQGKLKVLATQDRTEKVQEKIRTYEQTIRQAKADRSRAQSSLRTLMG